MQDTICLILGGGAGTRLYPLTKDRSKPAVPIGGKYRLIDIPVSNSLNSGINKILILTQFNSASLNNHINKTYRFDYFQAGFVDVLAAEQTMENTGWYQGTADAVRKSIKHITSFRHIKRVLILSGDQIYNMDFKPMLLQHLQSKADVTVAVLPCAADAATGFGLTRLDNLQVKSFVEKPSLEELDDWDESAFIQQAFPGIAVNKRYLASMGIYMFNIDALLELLDTGHKDFGKEVIPQAITSKKVGGFLFNGYWEDVGTIRTFWKANLDFAKDNPQFDFFKCRIFTHARFLPPSKISGSHIQSSLISDGCLILDSHISESVIGIRADIQPGCEIVKSIIMGNDWYPDEEHPGTLPGIGQNCIIRHAIIDKNARVGKNCRIVNRRGIEKEDGPYYYIRDFIVIIPKGAEVPDNTEI